MRSCGECALGLFGQERERPSRRWSVVGVFGTRATARRARGACPRSRPDAGRAPASRPPVRRRPLLQHSRCPRRPARAEPEACALPWARERPRARAFPLLSRHFDPEARLPPEPGLCPADGARLSGTRLHPAARPRPGFRRHLQLGTPAAAPSLPTRRPVSAAPWARTPCPDSRAPSSSPGKHRGDYQQALGAESRTAAHRRSAGGRTETRSANSGDSEPAGH